MRVRKIINGEPAFGHSQSDYISDTPESVAQNVMTRLALKTGEWFLDVTDGTPYAEQILGEHTLALYDMAIRQRILGTPGVAQIAEYSSTLDKDTRRLTVTATIDTLYGRATFSQTI